MMNVQRYADLEIRILERQEGGYPVEITLNPGQYFKRGFLDPALPTGDDARQTGARLFEWLFADTTLREAWEYARGRHPQRRIRLRLDADAPELHALPWESLRDSAASLDLTAADATPFSRFLAGTWTPGSAVLARPLKMLVAIAEPCDLSNEGLAPLDAEAEWDSLQKATAGLDVALTRLPPSCTLAAIETALRQGYHILHLIAHGKYNERQKRAALYLADDANQVMVVSEDNFAAMLKRQLVDTAAQDESQLRLVFLASCESATRDTADAFRGLAPTLVAAGVPAIVAMQDRISLTAAREFSRTFYRQLLQHGLVDLAGNQARATLLTAGSSEAATPVVFMRLPDGCLFTPEESAISHAPFMVDDLPSDFVARPVEFEALATALLAETRPAEMRDAPVRITAALCGAGGYGKTLLAVALCHDPRIREAFPDGVLWVTLGENPDVIGGTLKLYDALRGERPAFVDAEDAAQKLSKALGDKRCLLVVDDVWNAIHLRLFLRGGPHCARVITTRNRDTLPAGTTVVDVDAMREDEAVKLLGAGLSLETPNLPSLQKLAARLGKWPLLLSLANGTLHTRVERGQSLEDTLASVNRALDKRGMTAFDARDADARNQAVALTIDVSLGLLNAEERALYGKLAVFPEDVDVPLAALAVLWGATGDLDEFDVEELCQCLANLSLVQHLDLNRRVLRLHNVVRAYLASQHAQLPALHAELVNAYAVQCDYDAQGAIVWGTGSDDGYYYQHLPYHLAQAGRVADLRALLLDFDWLHAKLHAAGINALILDYDLPLSLMQMLPAPVPGDDSATYALHLIQGALRLSAHVLARDPPQLPGQLLGRLGGFPQPELRSLIQRTVAYQDTPWLRPLPGSLTLPGGPLLRTLTGHTLWVMAVAITPDGQRVVSASRDNTLKVWNLATGTEETTLLGHTGFVNAVAVTPDGQRAVSASDDGTLKVWSLETRAVLSEAAATLMGHTAPVNAVAVTPDGQRAVSASDDGMLKVWDLATGAEEATLTGHTDRVMAVTVTADGRWAVSAATDMTLKVWDLATGVEEATLTGHMDWVMAVAVTADGQRAVSAAADKTLKVWDLTTGAEEATLMGHIASVNAVALTPDGQRAVSAADDWMLKVWNLATGAEETTLRGHTSCVAAVAVTPDGRQAVSTSWDNTLKIWDISKVPESDLTTGATLSEAAATLTGHTYAAKAVAVTPDGRRVVSASWDNTLKVWDLSKILETGLVTGAEEATLIGNTPFVTAVAVTPDGRRVVSALDDGTLKVWDLPEILATGLETEASKAAATLIGHTDSVNAVAITPDGRQAVSASNDGTLKVWDLATGAVRSEAIATLIGHSNGVSAVAMTPHGRWVVSASFDKTLKVWDLSKILETGRETEVVLSEAAATLMGHTSLVNAVAVTPDGQRAVSASSDQTLKVWDLSKILEAGLMTGAVPGDAVEAVATLTGHTNSVNAVAVMPDGKRVVSASNDQTLKVWDLHNGSCIATFSADGSLVTCIVALNDTIIVKDQAGRVHLLKLVEPAVENRE